MTTTIAKKNMPELRFFDEKGVKYSDWKTYKLNECFNFHRTNSLSRSQLNTAGRGIKNIHYGDVHMSFGTHLDVLKDNLPYINNDIEKNTKEDDYCVKGDIVIADASEDRTDVGKAVEILETNGEKILAGLHTLLLRPKKEDFTLGFMGFLFATTNIRRQVMRLATGASVLGISKNSLTGININIPEKKEQEKISNFLLAIDRWINNIKAQKQNLEEYKRGMMQKIFSQEVRFKDDNGKYFPAWEESSLKDIFKKRSARNNGSEHKNVLTNSAQYGVVNQSEYFDKDIANQDNLTNYYVVETDDFVYNPRISKFAPVGPFKRNKNGRGIMSPLYTILRLGKGNLSFYEYYFGTNLWHRYMFKISNFGARHDRMNIRGEDFMKMPIPFPDTKEQEKIASFLIAIDKLISMKAEQVKNAETWKKGLLQKMFV